MNAVRRAVAGATAVMAVAGVTLASSAGAYIRPGVTTRIDLGPHGEQSTVDPATEGCVGSASCGSIESVISGNGRYVAFSSYAANLVEGDRNHGEDVFVKDLKTGQTTMASVSSDERPQVWANPLDTSIDGVAISRDGRYVVFISPAINLVPNDINLARDVFLRDLKQGTTTQVDVSSDGKAASLGVDHGLSISADGRYIAFASRSPNLVPGDTNEAEDVFIHDMKTQTTQRVSVSVTGAEGDGDSGPTFTISPTGRYLAFSSDATNLVPGDVNGQRDVFFRDLQKHSMEMISVQPDGSPVPFLGGNSDTSMGPGSGISADGRYVLFGSNSLFLIPNDSNRTNGDDFVRDRLTHRTERVSVGSDGTNTGIASGGSESITPDGRYVVFRTPNAFVRDDGGQCQYFTVGTPEGDNDIYLHDRRTGATELIGRATSGAHAAVQAGGCEDSQSASISDDATKVVFTSNATNLVKGDTNGRYDVFMRVRGNDQGVGGFAAIAPATPTPASQICVAGQCAGLCVQDTCLPPGEARIESAKAVIRPAEGDIYIEVQLARMTRPAAGASPVLYGLDFTAAGRRFQLRAQRLSGADANGTFRLYRQTAGNWTYVVDVHGGIGTTGQSVVAALPLSAIGLQDGRSVSNVRVFTAIGSLASGAARVLAELSLRGTSHV